ncbi:MAG: ribosome maturation factor RimM [Thermodesulfobacteriota bacterium]
MNKEYTVIGRITGLHGVRGEVKFIPYGGIDAFSWKAVFVEEKNGRTRIEIASTRRHKNGFLILFKGYSSIDSSKELVGRDVSVSMHEVPGLPEGEYYHSDLEGLEVITDEAKPLGTITGIIATGANDVIMVEGLDGEILIPIIDETIKEVDLKGNRIIVHLLEGLIPEKK